MSIARKCAASSAESTLPCGVQIVGIAAALGRMERSKSDPVPLAIHLHHTSRFLGRRAVPRNVGASPLGDPWRKSWNGTRGECHTEDTESVMSSRSTILTKGDGDVSQSPRCLDRLRRAVWHRHAWKHGEGQRMHNQLRVLCTCRLLRLLHGRLLLPGRVLLCGGAVSRSLYAQKLPMPLRL